MEKEPKKVIWKFATGQEIPDGAIYLSTVTQTKVDMFGDGKEWIDCWLVWHYFLVEAK